MKYSLQNVFYKGQTISSRSSLPETIKLKTYDKMKANQFYRNFCNCCPGST